MTLPADLAAVSGALAEAAAQAESGALIDLAGLDVRVAELCAAAEALPRAEGRALLGDLEALVGGLTALTGILTRQRDLSAGTDPHAARQRAAAVYGRPAASPASDDADR